MVRARSWIVKTSPGWLLGVPAIALLALLGEAVDIGGSQALVGAGMGGAVGLVALPFVVYDLGVRFGAGWAYSLTLLVGLGGVGAAIRGVPGALLDLGLVALGGVVLGVVTAPALRPPAVLSR
jgi:hypothetical protein